MKRVTVQQALRSIMEHPLATPDEAAVVLRITPAGVRKMMREGRLEAAYIGGLKGRVVTGPLRKALKLEAI